MILNKIAKYNHIQDIDYFEFYYLCLIFNKNYISKNK